MLISAVTQRSLAALAVVAIGCATAGPAPARSAPKELTWADLVPKTATEAKRKLKTFFGPPRGGSGAGAEKPSPWLDSYDVTTRPEDLDGAPPPRQPEGKWMSRPTGQQMTAPPEVKQELNGERVRLGGYVVPLDFNATRVTEFLLVPFVGACIHVPPPPANQIVYVKAENGFEVKGEFDPVYVTGTMSAKATSTGLAETGYTIDAESVEMRAQ